MKKLLCERVKLEGEEFKSILDWANEVEVSLEETSEVLNEEIVEDKDCKENKASNTIDDIGFLKGHMDLSEENSLVYDKKEDMEEKDKMCKNGQKNCKNWQKGPKWAILGKNW